MTSTFRLLTAIAGVMLLTLLVPSRRAEGHGTEYTITAADLVVSVDGRWAGTRHGGYYPVRVRILNRAADRTLTVSVESPRAMAGGLPRVTRTVNAPQNTTLEFTIPVPMVAEGQFGNFGIAENGELLKEFSRQLAFPSPTDVGAPAPSLLVISASPVDTQPFAHAADHMNVRANDPTATMAGRRGGRFMGGHYGAAAYDEAEVIPPVLLPEMWIAYSGLDIVAVPLDTLAGLPVAKRTAILDWVHTGGTLLIYNTQEQPSETSRVSQLVGFESFASTSAWQPADTNARETLQWPPRGEEHQQLGVEIHEPVRTDAGPSWSPDSTAFAKRPLMLGMVYAMPHDPFPGTVSDWHWLVRDRGPDASAWAQRQGFSARQGSDSFMNFMIPSVQSVPVFTFAALITLFAMLIGPINYGWLWRARRLNLLVITVPLIAVVTSLALFSYSAVAHGFGIKSRTRTLTVLDQSGRAAVTIARVALFSGISRSEGLRFSPDTAVYPIWPSDSAFDHGIVDWTDTQAFTTGWLPARTRTQFVAVSHRADRGRVTFGSPQGEQLSASSGLDSDIEAILVSGPDGRLYYGGNVAAGSSIELRRATSKDCRDFAALLRRHPLEVDEEMVVDEENPLFEYVVNAGSQLSYANSTVESMITNWSERLLGVSDDIGSSKAGPSTIGENTYLAVLKSDPRADVGVETARDSLPFHLLYGYY